MRFISFGSEYAKIRLPKSLLTHSIGSLKDARAGELDSALAVAVGCESLWSLEIDPE
jgi:hypothetical protein